MCQFPFALKSLVRQVSRLLAGVVLLHCYGFSQSPTGLWGVVSPDSIELSPDGTRLWYKLQQEWWEVGTSAHSRPYRSPKHQAHSLVEKVPEVSGTERLTSPRRSPDGQRIAYLDAERPDGPLLLFCRKGGQSVAGRPEPLSRMPVLDFRWAQDSNSLWVIGIDVTDEPVGLLSLNGDFKRLSRGSAMRRPVDSKPRFPVAEWQIGSLTIKDGV